MALFGILNVHKPTGRSSRSVVDDVERLARPAKVGHAGTLDPLASGVLVICVGGATRLVEYVQQMPKQYRAAFLFGRQSETDDVEGEVVELSEATEPTRATIENTLPQFLGEIQQRPPAHSAIKIAGRRSYALARRGQAVELASRPVTTYRLAVCRYEYPELELEIACGSGTYVRALGRDLAAALGTAAVMSALERTAVGQFRVEDAATLEALTADTLVEYLRPATAAVAGLPRIALKDTELNEIRNGRPLAKPASTGEDSGTGGPPVPLEWAAVNAAGELVAILRDKRGGQLWPAKNFF